MTDLQRTLFVPDSHRPYHDQRAWSLMLKVGRAFKPELLVTMGDLADFYGVSSHSKDPKRALRLDEEVADVNVALDELDSLGAKRRIYLGGNHEDRLTRYLRDRAPELFPFIDIPSLFRLKQRGWQYVPYRKHIRIGKLYLTHDIGVAGRYAVFRCLEAFEHSVVTGHTHRLAYVVEGNATGERKVSAQFGWLGDIKQVDYMTQVKVIKDWALGFGVGYLHRTTGVAYLVPVPIVNYSCVVEGKTYHV